MFVDAHFILRCTISQSRIKILRRIIVRTDIGTYNEEFSMNVSCCVLNAREMFRISKAVFTWFYVQAKLRTESIRFDVVARRGECYYWKKCRPRQQGGAIFMVGDGWLCARHKKSSRAWRRRPRRISVTKYSLYFKPMTGFSPWEISRRVFFNYTYNIYNNNIL